jgi:uncharacterized oxidoreductase
MSLAQDTKQGVLVTGGGSGIGLALAAEFLARGYDVAICGRDSARLLSAKRDLPELRTVQADVGLPEDHERLATWLKQHMPHVNVLVNNAGVQQVLDYRAEVPAAAIRTEIAINLFGPLALTAAVLPLLLRNADPAVINVTSGLAFCPTAVTPVYCATKAALHSFTLSLRHQLKDRVRVVELAPPIVATELDKANRHTDNRGGPPMISPQAFAAEAVARFDGGETEIVVGLANALRQRGEAMFLDING